MSADAARVSVTVAIDPDAAFELFTVDIDRWWQRGAKFRHAGGRNGIICIEPRPGGRLFESFDAAHGAAVFEVGTVQVWEPPRRLTFTWRNANYGPDELTEVDVEFTPAASGTLVTVTHRGLGALRADHPARHGLAQGPYIRMIALWWGEQMTAFRQYSN